MLLDLAGLLPSAEGRRVKFAEGNRTVIDGSFPESKQLIAGYWILQVPSMDEAVEWAKRAPFEALARIYPVSTAPPARSRSERCSSWRDMTHPRAVGERLGGGPDQAVMSRPMPRANSHTDQPI